MTEYLLYTPSSGATGFSSFSYETQLPGGEFFWLDIFCPSSHDLQQLGRTLAIHPLTIEDMQLCEAREKCEVYNGYVFLSVQLLDEEEFFGKVHTPKLSGDKESETYYINSGATCYILVFDHCLVTVHSAPLPFLPLIIGRRIAMSVERTPLTADWLAYLLLDEIVDDFTRQASLLQAESDAIEDLTLSLGRFDQSDMLRRIYAAHRRTTILSRLIPPKLEIVRSLSKRCGQLIGERTCVYLRDVQDHLQTLRLNLAEYQETLDRSHDNYVGQADIELAMAGHRMNLTVKKMTALTFMIGSAMAISSIMGMNVRVPFQDFTQASPFKGILPFVGLVFGMIAISVSIFAFGRRRKWL